MKGVGIDAVDVERFRRVLERRPGIIQRLFTADEQAYAERAADPTERYAVRFAAKEAVCKALQTGMWKFPLTDVEVVKAPNGAPALTLHGKAASIAGATGVTTWHLSLTHTELTAQAIAIAE